VILTPRKPLLMGILNVTPDSFSDGGVHYDAAVAIESGERMIAEGADILDVGGESTRPGSEPVSQEEELRRILPVVKALVDRGLTVSVDTMKAAVASIALRSGAKIINDVTALRDPRMAEVCAEAGCTVCLMHMKGDPKTMQQNPQYQNVMAEVSDFLAERAEAAQREGIAKERIWLDPGIGFGKATEHNLALLNQLDQIVALGYPVLIGVSRKAFIGRLLRTNQDPLPSEDRLEGTLAAQVLAQSKGASIIRAHDVLASRRAMTIAGHILGSKA
jgi:dihydropteroate synthase